MKNSLLILLLLLSPLFASAHAFYFGFAEVEYNPVSQKLEVTLTVTTHDLERAFEENGKKIANTASLTKDEIEMIEKYVNEHLSFIGSNNKSALSLVGNEVFLDGTSNFYFESEQFICSDFLVVHFDVLMETYPEQQNKLTFYFEDKTYTAAFTPMNKTQTIYFENQKQ